jgi:membrane fusion protein, multidrug efflux system
VSEQPTAGTTRQDLAPGPDPAAASPPDDTAACQDAPSLGAETAPATVEAGDGASSEAVSTAASRPAGQVRQVLSPWAARVGVWAMAALGVVVGVVMLGEFVFYRFARSMTNDAFVEAHIVNLSVQVEGLITRVHVEEQDRVRGGQVVAELDPVPAMRELELAAARRSVAEATLAFEQATLERLEQQFPRRVAVAEKDLAVADSELAQARTQLRLTTDDVEKAINQAAAAVASARAVLVKAKED